MGKKGKKQKKYSPKFKESVILDMREHYLTHRETVRKYWKAKTRAEEDRYIATVRNWERIYLTEGHQKHRIYDAHRQIPTLYKKNS